MLAFISQCYLFITVFANSFLYFLRCRQFRSWSTLLCGISESCWL